MKAILLIALIWSNVCLSKVSDKELARIACSTVTETKLIALHYQNKLQAVMNTLLIKKLDLRYYGKKNEWKKIDTILEDGLNYAERLKQHLTSTSDKEVSTITKWSDNKITYYQMCKELFKTAFKAYEKAGNRTSVEIKRIHSRLQDIENPNSNKQVELEL